METELRKREGQWQNGRFLYRGIFPRKQRQTLVPRGKESEQRE